MKFTPIPVLILSALTLGTLASSAKADDSVPFVYSAENTGAHYAAPTFPDFDHLPIVRPLPDPFRFADGTRDESFAAWERHRNEIKASIEKYEIGWKPDTSDLETTATYIPPGAVGSYGPNAGKLTVVTTRPSNGKTVTQTVKVWLPPSFPNMGPYPALIALRNGVTSSGGNANYASLGATVLSLRPIATIDFNHNAVTNYSGAADKSADPFYQMYPELIAPGHQTNGVNDSTSGQYAAWSWGVSRLIDGIVAATHQAENPLPIDVHHLAVSGCSYAGKMALFAGAFDERIALTIAQENGGGGAAAWRASQEIEGNREVESLTNTDKKWFATQLFQFSQNNVYKLPHDHHQLMAMVAPRALLQTGNTNFLWLANRPNLVASRATQRIYETLGIGDRFGFIIDGGHNHCAVPASQNDPIAAYLDKFLLGDTETDTNVRVHPFGAFDAARWTAWWGSDNPTLTAWNPGNGKLVQYINRPVNVLAGSTVKAGFAVSQPFAHPEANFKIVGGSVQLDVYNPDGRCYTLTVPFDNTLSYVIPANFTGWVPSPNQKSALTYQGSATAGFNGSVKNIVFSAVGANLTTGAGNPAGPGLATDTGDPVDVRFHVDTGTGGANGSWSPTSTVVNQ